MSHRPQLHHSESSIDDPIERRCTGPCGYQKPWSEFHLKSNGVNGRDSRCKSCVALARKSGRIAKKRQKRLLGQSQLKRIVVGELTEETISEFGELFAKGVIGLIEKGIV